MAGYSDSFDPVIIYTPGRPMRVQDVLIEEVPSNFILSAQVQQFIKDWEAKGEVNKARWEFRHVLPFEEGKVKIQVSPTMFSHYIVSKRNRLGPEEYPHPFTVNTLAITLPDRSTNERKVLLARRDKGSVEKSGTIAFLGSGFHDREVDPNTGENILTHPFYASNNELLEEAVFLGGDIFLQERGFLGLGWGSGNVTAFFYQFLGVRENQVKNWD